MNPMADYTQFEAVEHLGGQFSALAAAAKPRRRGRLAVWIGGLVAAAAIGFTLTPAGAEIREAIGLESRPNTPSCPDQVALLDEAGIHADLYGNSTCPSMERVREYIQDYEARMEKSGAGPGAGGDPSSKAVSRPGWWVGAGEGARPATPEEIAEAKAAFTEAERKADQHQAAPTPAK